MGSVVLQQSESSLLKDNSNNNNQQQYHSDQENLFMMIGKISRDNHHHSLEQQLLSTSSTAFERGDYSHQHDNIIDEAIVQDEGHQEFNYCDRTLLQQQSHLQLEEQQYDHGEPTYENQTDDDVETLFLGSSSCEGSSTAIIIDKARKNNNTIRRILPPQTTFLEKESKLILPTTLTTIDTNNIINYYHQYHHQQEYNDNRKQQALGMNERSNIENNAQSLVDQQQQEQQACEQEKQNTTLRKTCNEEILIHNSNDSIIIRSYNYETDEKQVNKIFVEGIKSIVPTYLQTFYLFIHHFGIIQVFAILSLFYISSFIFQFGIIKLLFNPDDSSTTINNHTSLLSIILSFTNLSASSTIYALISTFITCTSMVVLLVCGLSKYVDYSARSYIYQQFKFSDMSNIQKFYIWDEDNHFWVAQLKSTGEIVGTIGVRKRANQEETVELKRMSVSSSMKRKGIASLMLNHLVKWSKEKGYKTIVLSTSSLQAAAVDFYKKNGFSIVKMRRYSRFLPTAHLTFEKHL